MASRSATAARASHGDEEPATSPPPVFDFCAATAVRGEMERDGDELRLVTGAEQWSYTVFVPAVVPPDLAGWRARLRLTLQVDAGRVEVGLLDSAQSRFVASAQVGSGPAQSIELQTPELRQAGPLVLRNAWAEGASQARCRLLSVDLAPPFFEFDEPWTPASAEAVRLAQEFGAAAGRLAAALNRLDDPADVLQVWRRRNEPVLRSVLGALGLAAPDVGDERLAAIFASLDADRLVDLATALAPPLTLGPIPGWRFASFRASADPAVLVRYALWLALVRKKARRAIAIPWLNGIKLHLSPASDLSLAIFVGGAFEPNEFHWLNGVLTPGMVFIDGGANEGAYTLFAAAKVGEGGQVIAVEPSPRELDRLRANIVVAGLENVDIVAAALADEPGSVKLRIAESMHAGHNSVGEFLYENVQLSEEASVAARTLDEIVATQGLKRVDAIKLDIEGSELRALRGGRETLRRFRPILIIEANDRGLRNQGSSLAELFAFLEAEDYALSIFDERTGLLAPFAAGSGFDNVIASPRAPAPP